MADWESCYHNGEISAVLASCTEANITEGPELYACSVALVSLRMDFIISFSIYRISLTKVYLLGIYSSFSPYDLM
jgi:hypothetical protein